MVLSGQGRSRSSSRPPSSRKSNSTAGNGTEVKKNGEETADTPVGLAKTISYLVWDTATKKGFGFTMTTAEHAGGPFQASIQIAKVTVE